MTQVMTGSLNISLTDLAAATAYVVFFTEAKLRPPTQVSIPSSVTSHPDQKLFLSSFIVRNERVL